MVSTPHLTVREEEVLDLASRGLTNDAIARSLGISRRTVESHISTLFNKLGVSRRAELAAAAGALTQHVQVGHVATTEATVLDTAIKCGSTDTAEPRDLTADLEELREQLRSYESAISRISDRQTSLFTERIEITLTIGDGAAEDSVVERRWTTPKPYLVYRVAGPILPYRPQRPLTREDLAVSCEVVGRDVGVAVQMIPDSKRRQRMLVTFQPGLQEETEWVLRYRCPGLWNPLRDDGEDVLLWSPGTMKPSDTATSIAELSVRLIFPPDTMSMNMIESRAFGVVEEEHLADGRRMIVWRELQPGGASYRWIVKMTRN